MTLTKVNHTKEVRKNRLSVYLDAERYAKLQDIYSFRRKNEGTSVSYSQIVEEGIDVAFDHIEWK